MALLPKRSVAMVQLPNGLPVVCLHLRHLHVGQVLLLVRGGPRFETAATHGLSHFCEHMLFRGAGRFESAPEIARALEAAGGGLDAATYRDCTIYSTALAPGRLSKVLEVLAAMTCEPAFRSIEVERRIVLEELRELEDDDGEEIDAENLMRGVLFDGHPLARRIDGTAEGIGGFSRRDLRAHHRRCYSARNMALVVAGPEPPAVVERAARRHLARIPPGEPLSLGSPPGGLRRPPRLRFVSREGSQTEVRFGFVTPGERAPSATALLLTRRLLDDGAGSLLQAELVERRGLAYELWADLDLAPDVGVLEFGASVAHHKVFETVRAMLRIASRLAREGPDGAELARAKQRAVWAFHSAIDSAPALGEWVGRGVLFGLDYDVERAIARLKSSRCAQVQAALRAVLDPRGLGLVAVGKTPRRTRTELRKLLRGLPQR